MISPPVSLADPSSNATDAFLAEQPLPSGASSLPGMWELLAGLQSPSAAFPFWLDGGHEISITKKMRKCFLEYHLQVRDVATGQSRTLTAIAKVYTNQRGAYAHEVLTYLWARGFQEDAAYAVPRPLGFLAEQCLLLQGKAPGTPLANWLHHHPAGPEGARAAARWLVHLHNLPPTPDPIFRQTDPTATLERYRHELQAVLPAQAARLDRLFDRLLQRLRESATRHPLGFIHGDYHALNIFLSDSQVTVIDFDTFGLGEPAQDVGYFLAQNAIQAWLRHRDLHLADEPGCAFVAEYTAQGQTLLWPRVAVYVARTFLQSLHYELCVLHTDNQEVASLWLDLAEDALAHSHCASIGFPL
jgi:hypothetical protein